MTQEEAIAWVEDDKNAKEYMQGFDNPREAVRAYDCLLDLVESGHVTPEQLPEYGFPMPGDAAGLAPSLSDGT